MQLAPFPPSEKHPYAVLAVTLLRSRVLGSASTADNFSLAAVSRRVAWLLLAGALGCRGQGCLGSSLEGEVDGQRFVRCAQADAPAERAVRVGALQLTIDGRVLSIEGASELRIAAFTGPVGTELAAADLDLLRDARPGLIFYLGGLGDSEAVARQNLTSLAALHVPSLFIAGGADRLPIIDAAFAALGEGERDYVLHASGLREVRIGSDRFVIAAGAARGRYALDALSCGLTDDDMAQLQGAALETQQRGRTWLLSWHAPAGAGVSEGFGGTELGSPDLQALGKVIGAEGGLFAYPEVQAGKPRMPGLALVVPRLSRVGTARADGSRLRSQVARLLWSREGLVPSP